MPIEEFVTLEFVGTLGGAAAVVFLVANVLRRVFQLEAPWVGLLLSFVVSAFLFFFATDRSVLQAALAIINAFVIYSAAFLANESIGRLVARPRSERAVAHRDTSFFASW